MKILKNILNNNATKRVSKNFGSLLILQATNFLLPLIALPYLVRILGTDRFGLVMFAQSFILFFNVIVDFGFNLSATREISINRNNRLKVSEIFSSVYLIKVGLIILSLIIISGIVFFIPRFNTNWEIYFLSFGVVIGQALFPVWYFQGVENMLIVTIINIIAKLIFTILIFVLIKSRSDYIMVPIYNSLGFILSGFLGLYVAMKNVKFIIPKFSHIRNLFKESLQLFISNISATLYTASNTIILGLFTNNSLVGIYSSMEKLVLAVKNLYTPIFQAIFPWISSKKPKEISRITSKLIFPISFIGITVFIIIFFFAKDILWIIYGDESIMGYINVFKILGLISIFSGLNMLFNMLFLSALKKYNKRMKIFLTAGIINVILSLILVKNYNIYGTAITVTFTEFLLLLLGWFYYKKYENKKTNNLTNRMS